MIGWRRVIAYTHRWLGIAGGVLFIAWFVSGIVLMYVGMPSLSSDERLASAPVLDLSTVALTPAEAATRVGAAPDQMRVGMLSGRPVYRFFASRPADDGVRGQWGGAVLVGRW